MGTRSHESHGSQGHGEGRGEGHGEHHGEHGEPHEGTSEEEPHPDKTDLHEENPEAGLEHIIEKLPPLPDVPRSARNPEHDPGQSGGPTWVPSEVPKGPRDPGTIGVRPRHDHDVPPPPPASSSSSPSQGDSPHIGGSSSLEAIRAEQDRALREYSQFGQKDLDFVLSGRDSERGIEDSRTGQDRQVLDYRLRDALGEDAVAGFRTFGDNLSNWHDRKVDTLQARGASDAESQARGLLEESINVYRDLAPKKGLDEHVREELVLCMKNGWDAVNRDLADLQKADPSLVESVWSMERSSLRSDPRKIREYASQRKPVDHFGAHLLSVTGALREQGKGKGKEIEGQRKAMTSALDKLGGAFKSLVGDKKKPEEHAKQFRSHIETIERGLNAARFSDIPGIFDKARTADDHKRALEGFVAGMLRKRHLSG